MERIQSQVAVIGNVGIDTNAFLHGQLDLVHEANFTENLDTVGQAGGYSSRGYARLGYQTSFIGYIGADKMGDLIRETFEREGIDTRGLFIDPLGTCRSINLISPDGSRRNFYDGKSHMELHPPLEYCAEILAGTQLVHFNIPNWARELLPLARQFGAVIACDIQDVIDPHDPYRREFIHQADYLFFSAVNHPDPAPIIHIFLQMNPALAVIASIGAQGCMLGTSSGVAHFPAVNLDLPVVDTNGAGDALAVGFLVSRVLEGRSQEDSILRGQISARYKCTQKSTSGNMVTRELLDHYFLTLRS